MEKKKVKKKLLKLGIKWILCRNAAIFIACTRGPQLQFLRANIPLGFLSNFSPLSLGIPLYLKETFSAW